ncbi:H-NS histone family protein [Pseudomonas aeruginosa]|uniref:H-NS histone family protein n=1 Tax=Pseudomonas aeruginosa TaxID=287 RepID=UPI003524375B
MSSDSGDDDDDKKEKTAGNPRAVSTAHAIVFVPLGERPPRGKARYRDPANPFNTWSGRGKRPTWLREYLDAGRTLAEFEIRDDKED